jgi:hypothetical protein
VGGSAFLAFGFTSVRVNFCDPMMDLGKVFMNSALN